MKHLNTMKCVACEGGVPALALDEAQAFLREMEGWEIAEDSKSISKRFSFKGFYRTMSFVNAIAWMANQENHHPDMCVGYDYCEVRYTTHAIDGLSKNDFICAAKVEELLV